MTPSTKEQIPQSAWLKCPAVQALLSRVEVELRQMAGTGDPDLQAVSAYVAHPAAKRLRPALALLAASFGSRNPPFLPRIAAAIEMVHAATLYHDDIVDEATLRRGLPSANVRWGNRMSAFAGDFLLARAAGVFAAAGDTINRAVSRAIADLWKGHMMEAESSFNPDLDESVILEIAERKTGVLFRMACEAGALAAEVATGTAERLLEYGRCFGIAFQLIDDILDVVATEREIGKPIGADLRAGIYTLPVAFAARQETAGGLRLRSLLGEREIGDNGIAEALSLVRAGGGPEHAAAIADRYLESAKEQAAALPSGAAAQSLSELAESFRARTQHGCGSPA